MHNSDYAWIMQIHYSETQHSEMEGTDSKKNNWREPLKIHKNPKQEET